jgi:hypothetical protein
MLERAKSAGRAVRSFGKRFPTTTTYVAGSAAVAVAYTAITGQPPYIFVGMMPLAARFLLGSELRRNAEEERLKMFPPPLYFAMQGMYEKADECCRCLEDNPSYGGICPYSVRSDDR